MDKLIANRKWKYLISFTLLYFIIITDNILKSLPSEVCISWHKSYKIKILFKNLNYAGADRKIKTKIKGKNLNISEWNKNW